MSHHDTHARAHSVPTGTFRVPQTVKIILGVFAFVGILTFVAGLKMAPERVWPNYLLNYFYFLVLSLFGVFFTALQHITNAYWSVTVRRISEALISYLPVALLLGFVLLFLGSHHLYEWAHPDVVAEDHLLQLKSAYLNPKFMAIRFVLFIGLWTLIGLKMRKNSLKQDETGDAKLTLSNIKLSALFLPIFAISFTLISFDLIMSLEPHWFSTIFGVYCFAGLFYGGLSLMAFLTIAGKRLGVFPDSMLNENHIHDIGKLMFAFTVFWAYIMFSQFMLIWYANLPEEITYYLLRLNKGWWQTATLLFLAHFVIPFFLLLPRGVKRNPKVLFRIACFMLLAQWLDFYFLVMPVFFKSGPVFGWVEVGMALGFLGLFGIVVGTFLQKAPALPQKDPRMEQCLAHAQ